MQKSSFFTVAFRKKLLKYRYVLLVFAVAVLFLPQIEPIQGTIPGMVYFLGRFHPLVIHFPVVLVFLSLVFELLKKYGQIRVTTGTLGLILALGLVGSLVSVTMGFMLYLTGEYAGDLVLQHLWGGVLLTSLMALACFLFLTYRKSQTALSHTSYITVLIIANAVLVYTSHQGGSLTHGKEYLTEYLPKFNNANDHWEPKPMEEMLVFEDVLIPILDKKCMSCHNTSKTKGGLLLTSYEDILKGGKSEHPTLMPGDLNQSQLYQRVILPKDDDKHMPPDGKLPLTQEEIVLLEWWISQGAETSLAVMEASTDTKVQPFINAFLTDLENQQKARFMQQQELENMMLSVSTGNRFALGLDPYGDGKIALSMAFPPSSFEDSDLISLQQLFPQLSKVSLVSSNVTDDAFYHIGQMSSLRELYLQQTKIDGSGLIFLVNLPNLQLLDLSKTEINDGNLLHVLRMDSLEDLYLNSTKISPEIVQALKSNRPDLRIHLERGSFF